MNLIVSKQELIDIGIAEDKIQELIQLKINNSKTEWQDLLPKIGEEANVFSFSLERKKVDFQTEAEYSFSPKYNISFLAKKIDLFIRMTNFAFIKNDGWEANWNDEKSIKHGLVIYNNKVELWLNFHNIFIFGITFKDKEISKEALDIFGVEIENLFIKSTLEIESNTPINAVKEFDYLGFDSNSIEDNEKIILADNIIRQRFYQFRLMNCSNSSEIQDYFLKKCDIDFKTLLFFIEKYNISLKKPSIKRRKKPNVNDLKNILFEIEKGTHVLDLNKLYSFSITSIIELANKNGYFLKEDGSFSISLAENIDLANVDKIVFFDNKKIPFCPRGLGLEHYFEDAILIDKMINPKYSLSEILDFFNASRNVIVRICRERNLPYSALQGTHKVRKNKNTDDDSELNFDSKNQPNISSDNNLNLPSDNHISGVQPEKKEFVLPPKTKKWWQL